MSKYLFASHFAVVTLLFFSSANVSASTPKWTLYSTAERLIQEAPLRAAAQAEVMARKGGVKQAGVWPNPSIELGASNSMGKDDGQGGTDLNNFTVNQAVPLSGRLGQQRKRAMTNLKQAEANAHQQNLLLEYDAARVFHELQFTYAHMQLAKQRLESADEFQRVGRLREKAGDLSRLARLRLDLVRESAMQTIATTKGKYYESLSDYLSLLNMSDSDITLEHMKTFPSLPSLLELENKLKDHPALIAARQNVESANYSIAIARANRFVDPEIWVARERDVLGGYRQNVTAFGVAMEIPLWNTSKGNIDTAQANRQKAQFKVNALQRKLHNNLKLNHLHLSHLITQGQQYRTHLLKPAEDIFKISRKGFVAGNVKILNLVDAVDVYFSTHIRYLELLREAWLEAASLRRNAGISLLENKGSTQ